MLEWFSFLTRSISPRFNLFYGAGLILIFLGFVCLIILLRTKKKTKTSEEEEQKEFYLTRPPVDSNSVDLTLLEAKLREQTKVLDVLTSEKEQLEKTVIELKTERENLIQNSLVPELESQLAEYRIIENDLANLKKLQEENEKLKAALKDKESSTPNTVDSTFAPLEDFDTSKKDQTDLVAELERLFKN